MQLTELETIHALLGNPAGGDLVYLVGLVRTSSTGEANGVGDGAYAVAVATSGGHVLAWNGWMAVELQDGALVPLSVKLALSEDGDRLRALTYSNLPWLSTELGYGLLTTAASHTRTAARLLATRAHEDPSDDSTLATTQASVVVAVPIMEADLAAVSSGLTALLLEGNRKYWGEWMQHIPEATRYELHRLGFLAGLTTDIAIL